ncbi:MAG: hypothetical protein AAB363_08435 [Planctomycetota bacterium]
MSQQSTETERKTNLDSIGPALSHWKQRLRELPEVRVEKVQSVRGAIRSSCYESEQVLESTLQQLSNEVGVLCRKDSSAGSA